MKEISQKRSHFELHLLVLLFFSGLAVSAQGLQDSLKHDDEDIVSSIAPYSEDVREAILNVSQYPQKLVQVERLQARSSQSFQDLVSKYPRDVQEKFYDLSRFPELIAKLTTGSGRRNADEIESILSAYPVEVGTNVKALYPTYETDLATINKRNEQSQAELQKTIHSLPENIQHDFKTVIGMPDVMSLLTDRVDLTVSLGEAFRNNPAEVRQSLNNLHDEIGSQNAKDLDDYKSKVAADPALQEEMKKSSKDFANNYSETDDGTPNVVNNYYSANPYPYWTGYPYWYPSPIWYPQPLYYHTGFYLGTGGNMVIVGLPSYGYSNWFFNYGYRRYPRMYGSYNVYYGNHRNFRNYGNVYRGYNAAVRQHFNGVNHLGNTNGRTRPTQQSNIGRQNNGLGNRSENFRNSINYRGSNFNNQRLNNFNSQQYHQQRWQGVGGSGMQRSNGGVGMQRSGGGQRGGGGGGGRSRN